MWALENKTPYAAERTWVRDKTGAHLWVVAVKATFTFQPDGHLALADEQAPCLLAPEYFGEPGRSSLRYDADVVPPKPATDVVIDATAHAPGGRPVARVPVSMRVGDVEKTIMVHGVRVYFAGPTGALSMSAGKPFVTRPIRYEDAYGGADLADPDPQRQKMDARNPVGRGVAATKQRLVHQPAHSLEYPDGDPTRRGPAGFGPIASHWSPRRERAGTYDDKWAKTKKPLLADDYDERFLLCAPDDQIAARHVAGDAPIALVNMTPEGTLRLRVPKIFLTFATLFGRRREEHRAKLGTIAIEPEERTLKLVWQTSLPVRGRDTDYLDRTVIAEKPYLT